MAARLYAYTLLIVMLALAFNYAGIEIGSEALNNFMGLVTGQISTSEFFNNLFSDDSGILIVTVGTGIIAGLFARAQLENFLVLPFITGSLVVLIQTFQSLIVAYSNNTYPDWGIAMITLILVPLAIGYIITLVEWFRGNI